MTSLEKVAERLIRHGMFSGVFKAVFFYNAMNWCGRVNAAMMSDAGGFEGLLPERSLSREAEATWRVLFVP